MRCPNCSREMKNVLHFEPDKQYQYNECPHCYNRTKNKRIHFDDVVREEASEVNIKNSQTRKNNTKGDEREKKIKKKNFQSF